MSTGVRVLLSIVGVLCVAPFAGAGPPNYEMRLGVNGGIYPDGPVRPEVFRMIHCRLDELGMVWLRHPGKGSSWAEVEPQRGTWNWDKLDGVLLDNDHPWLFEVWGQIGTAYPFKGDLSSQHLQRLAREGGQQAVMAYIKAHSVDLTDRVQRADAERYVKMFVARYKDRVRYWESGNEGIVSPDRFEIVQHTCDWVKAVHPESQVVVTVPAGDDDGMYRNGLQAFDRLMARGMGRYFDIGNIHYYGRIDGDFEARLEKRHDDYKAVLDRHKADKSVWVTETSTSSASDSRLSGPSSEAIQARHVVQRAVVFFGKGAEKVFWHDYRATYANNKFYKCNLIDPEMGKPKPGYHTFRLLVHKLGFFRSVTRIEAGRSRVYCFTRSDGGRVLVARDRGSTTVDVSSHLKGPRVRVTHIVEAGPPPPKQETAEVTGVPVSPSSVLIEEM